MNNQTKGLAVFDLDGTLLNNDRAISRENYEAIKKLHDKGYEIVLASGRPEILMRVYFLGIDFICYVISANGGIIRQVRKDAVIHHCPINAQAVQKIIQICEQIGSDCDLYSHGGMREVSVQKMDKILTDEMIFDFKNKFLKDRNMSKFPCEKIFIREPDSAKLEKLRTIIMECIPEVDITQSSFQALDIMAKGVNKGTAVRWLSQYLKIPSKNVVAFGDHLNDKEMLECAGISIVCSNAVDQVKEIATYVMPETNNENGVAKGIYQILLNKDYNL